MGSIEPEQQHVSAFSDAKYLPPDGIFEVQKRFLADSHPQKINLGQGTYRDENGQPWILPSVRMAKETLLDANHEYLPIMGLKALRDAAAKLVFEGTKAFAENRIASCQSLSGTGALLLAGLCLKKANTGIKTIYITDPSWPNHDLLFGSMGFALKKLPYYRDGAYDHEAVLAALRTAEPHTSAVVLHTCAHNPTGCDPTREQWAEIAGAVAGRGVFPIFDAAYLGFNSGSVDRDAWPIRHFVEDRGLEAAVCLSFAKNLGLYGERAGAVLVAAAATPAAATLDSILENCQRSTVSTPPAYGARIAATVLSTPAIREQWARDLETMSGRIRRMRERLAAELARLGTPGPDWSLLATRQSGMFGYSGLTPAQVRHLEERFHVYMAATGRISVAGLNEGNVEYFARAVDETVRTVP